MSDAAWNPDGAGARDEAASPRTEADTYEVDAGAVDESARLGPVESSRPLREGSHAATVVRCAGCNRELQAGDRVIVDTSSGFTGSDADPEIDDLIAGIFGGTDSKLYLCEDCTEPGVGYHPITLTEADLGT